MVIVYPTGAMGPAFQREALSRPQTPGGFRSCFVLDRSRQSVNLRHIVDARPPDPLRAAGPRCNYTGDGNAHDEEDYGRLVG